MPTTPDADSGHVRGESEVFELKRSDAVIIGLVCVAAGIALGFFLPALGSVAARFPIPFGDAIEKLSGFDEQWVVIARPFVGAVLGAVAALVISASVPRLRIDDDAITVDTRNGHPVRISRESFSTAYFDGGKLTILTAGGHQAFHGSVEGKKDRVAAAFTARGYRWGEI
ncbi:MULTISPECIES: YqeB family protein [Brevibacterium]|uniref:YqeB n=4 Tax=Bacteria TaxID=2 RepID=K9AFG8_9MICO|nr:hypothetical protein [Brevibacterium casei]NJE67005.1 hypothetical protein [Brevibacterium sp. LS14]EKU46069.1 YqeB [Brevibacterium casei S18]MBE4693152.1 hypothetical protein [Brevibacterium casei]MBY3576275.1 hypothetical protein [Brevibacterium casei]MCT1551800.1 hypothetical protein [Brevibacterium casei]